MLIWRASCYQIRMWSCKTVHVLTIKMNIMCLQNHLQSCWWTWVALGVWSCCSLMLTLSRTGVPITSGQTDTHCIKYKNQCRNRTSDFVKDKLQWHYNNTPLDVSVAAINCRVCSAYHHDVQRLCVFSDRAFCTCWSYVSNPSSSCWRVSPNACGLRSNSSSVSSSTASLYSPGSTTQWYDPHNIDHFYLQAINTH